MFLAGCASGICAGSYCFCSVFFWALIGPHAFVEGGGRESPGRRGTFLCFAKEKYPKERRPRCLRPLRFATGQPAVLAGGVRCGTRCALARSAQTAAASQSTKRVCPAAHAPPRPLRSSAHPEGQGEPNIHTGLCFARPSLRSAWRLRPRDEAERSNGPNGCWLFGCSAVPPLLAAPAAGRLRGGMGVEAPMLRELTRRSCLNGARQREVSSAAHPATDTPQVCPFAQRRGRRLGVAFLLGTFIWRSKEKYLARRGDSRPPPATQACGPISAQKKTLQNQ